ncbi:MAG: hypothetical protein JXA21_15250 [Anaerolineae bacterium]|nr:hypothetical protein [Anaerolineae bacterium]
MDIVAIIMGILAGVVTLVLTSGLVFKSAEDFEETMSRSSKINPLFLTQGEVGKRFWARIKTDIWVLSGLIVGAIVAGTVEAVLTALFG